MSTIFVCDGCGRHSDERMTTEKPHSWFERSIYIEHGPLRQELHACSRECIDKVADKHGGTRVVLPV